MVDGNAMLIAWPQPLASSSSKVRLRSASFIFVITRKLLLETERAAQPSLLNHRPLISQHHGAVPGREISKSGPP